MLPSGADAVVPVELTDGGIARVAVRAEVAAGNAVRYLGGDALEGETLLVKGTRLKPMHIAVAASAGRARVVVRPRPRVVVLATGNELAEPGTPLVPGRIWESNSYMIAAAAREAGAIAYRHATVPDDPAGVLPTLEEQLLRADLLVTTGGVSMGGEHDVVKAALGQLGTVTFQKVAMQPGMPQGFGTVGDDRIPIFTLPGNPVSAYVSFQLFVRPAIGALQGQLTEFLPMVSATLTGPLRSPAGRRSFLRGVLSEDKTQVTPLSGQGSHQIAALGRATALIVVPEWVVTLGEGDKADVLVLPLFLGDAHHSPDPRLAAASVRRCGLLRRRGSASRRARWAVIYWEVFAWAGGSGSFRMVIVFLSMSDAAPARLTHLDETGAARMVDVASKDVTVRTARASGRVLLSAQAVAALRDGRVPKGDALAVARIAGIAGAKRTPDLIPLCHPLGLHGVSVDVTVEDWGVAIEATVRTADRTGVEMEALTSVSVAALTMIDMIKSVDKGAVITDVRLESKDGGKSGPWRRTSERTGSTS